jgi:hypothetical protein
MYGTRTLNVVKLIVQRAGTYNAQYRRPYTTHVDAVTMNRLMTAVENKAQITGPLVAKIANDVIRPAAQPEQTVEISNGWEAPRLRFLLEIQITDHMGQTKTTYVNGFTSADDRSYGNHINPEMPFFINNIATLKQTSLKTPLGNQNYMSLIDSSQVLTNAAYQGAIGNGTVYSMRPENIIKNMESLSLGDASGEFVLDATAHLSTRGVLNRRANNITPTYIANTLDSYLQAARGVDTSNTTEIYQATANALMSADLDSNEFISAITANRRRTGSNLPDNFFTLDELVRIDPNTLNVTNVVEFGNNNMHAVGSTQMWHGTDATTLFATTLVQALPGYMSNLCVNRLHFRATNKTIDGSISVVVVNIKGYNAGLPMVNEAQAITFRLTHELLMSLSHGNQIPFDLDVNCDFLGETWVEVSLGGEPLIPYVFPTFCDSLMAPIVTHQKKQFDGLTNDFTRMVTDLVDNDSTISKMRSTPLYEESGSLMGSI